MQVDTLNGETQGVRDKMGNWEGMRSIDESLDDFLKAYRELSKGFEIDREWLKGWREGEG